MILNGQQPAFNRCKTPVYRCKTPVYRYKAPVYRFKVPVYRFKAPVNRFKAPVYRVKAPVNRFKAAIHGLQAGEENDEDRHDRSDESAEHCPILTFHGALPGLMFENVRESGLSSMAVSEKRIHVRQCIVNGCAVHRRDPPGG